jgi:hypothetical protein
MNQSGNDPQELKDHQYLIDLLQKTCSPSSHERLRLDPFARIRHQNGNYAIMKGNQVVEAQLGELKLIKSDNRWLIERYKQQGVFNGRITADTVTGDITMIAREGYKTVYQKDGCVVIMRKDGSQSLQKPDGSKVHFNADLTVSMVEQGNGLKVRFKNGKVSELQTKRDGLYTLLEGRWFHTLNGITVTYHGVISIFDEGTVAIRPICPTKSQQESHEYSQSSTMNV